MDNVRNKEAKLTYLTFVLFKCIILFPKSEGTEKVLKI